MVADLAQAQQAFEHFDPCLLFTRRIDQAEQHRAIVVSLGIIQASLLRFHLTHQHPFGTRRQIGGDLVFGAPQNKGIGQPAQQFEGGGAAFTFASKGIAERFGAAQQPRVEEGEL